MSLSRGFSTSVLKLVFSISAVILLAVPSSWATVSDVDDSSYKAEVEDSALPVFIDFHAVWCAPCKKVAPFIDELSNDYQGTIKFVRVDVDKAPKTAERYGIEPLPTMVLRSKKVSKGVSISGFRSKEDLKAFIETALKKVQ